MATAATTTESIGVILMTFGSPTTPEDISRYLTHVRRGTRPSAELIAEFQRRYRMIGGSSLVQITNQQAQELENLLNAEASPGITFCVAGGMLHSPPWISDAVDHLIRTGSERIICIIMSPQYSSEIMKGYLQATRDAVDIKGAALEIRFAVAWHDLPSFVESLARRVRDALSWFPSEEQENVPVLLTAHSLPRRVIEREPEYVMQLHQTASEVAEHAGLSNSRWRFAYQSAGHTPEEWMKPDLKDLFPELKAAGHKSVLVVPVQFLTDHLETLYDIDVAARAEAEEVGLEFRRIEMFNALPEFIRVLSNVVHREIAQPYKSQSDLPKSAVNKIHF